MHFITVLFFCFVIAFCNEQNYVSGLGVGPQVYSVGAQTSAEARGLLNDADFTVDLHFDKSGANATGSHVEKANVGKHDVFGLPDVQSGVERVFLRNGAVYASHSHPRVSETLYVESGEIMTSLRFEGEENARIIRLALHSGRVTVFPQGLPHRISCTSADGCTYISFFNSADYGIVAFPNFV